MTVVAERGEVVHPVAGEDDRGAARGQPGQDAVDVTGAGRVEAVGRLVEDQQPRARQQRGGQPEALAHPEREAADAVVGDVGQADLVERAGDPVAAVAAQPRQRGEVLPRAQRGVEAGAVHEPGDAVGQRARPAHRLPEDLQLAGVGLGQPEQQAQQRRLAGAVGPDQPVDLTRRDGEVDAVERDDLAERLPDPGGPRRRAHLSPCPRSGCSAPGTFDGA